MMITRKIHCRKCGKECFVTYPDKLSEIGKDFISLCDVCNEMEIKKLEAAVLIREAESHLTIAD